MSLTDEEAAQVFTRYDGKQLATDIKTHQMARRIVGAVLDGLGENVTWNHLGVPGEIMMVEITYELTESVAKILEDRLK